MSRDPISVPVSCDQQHSALVAVHHGMAAIPVVDAAGAFMGVIPPATLLRVLYQEHIEDIHRLSGLLRETEMATRALEAPPVRRVWDRLPWLLVGLAGSIVATAVMARFETTLEHNLQIAYFVPGIVYLADAIGTQTEAIAVRGLSLTRAQPAHVLRGELGTGLIVGAILAAITFPVVLVAFRSIGLAVTVAVSILVAGTAATGLGLLFPTLLSRLGKDPAFGSGPLATVLQDIASLLVYFAIASLLLPI
jgi:magnesium transporter